MGPRLRATKAAAAKQAAPAVQITDLSFNNAGRAFQHPPGFDEGPTYLNAKEVNSKTYKKALAGATPDNHAKSRVAISLTERELLQDPPAGLYRYLLVGWVPQNTNSEPEATKGKHGGIVGITRPSKDDIITFDTNNIDNLPLMAVVEMTDNENETSTPSFVLLHQYNDVCTPYTVGADEIYYLSIFRDHSTAKHTRKANWNRLVRKFALAQDTKVPTAKQAVLRRARDQSKLVLPPMMSLKNEVGALIAAYSQSKEPWCMDELAKLLEGIDNDLTMAPPENTALHAFANLGTAEAERYTEAEAKDLVEEMLVAWPDSTPQVQHVCILGQALQQAKLDIDYEHLQPFIREGLHTIAQAFGTGDLDQSLLNDRAEQLTNIAQETNDTVKRILGFGKAPMAVSAAEEGALVRAIKNKLVEVVRTDEEFVKMLKTAAGDQALAMNYQDIWGAYCEQSDTDGARAAFMDVTKFNITAMRHKEAHLAQMVEKIIDILENAGF